MVEGKDRFSFSRILGVPPKRQNQVLEIAGTNLARRLLSEGAAVERIRDMASCYPNETVAAFMACLIAGVDITDDLAAAIRTDKHVRRKRNRRLLVAQSQRRQHPRGRLG